jgi:methionyl-tRNA formyltransferase
MAGLRVAVFVSGGPAAIRALEALAQAHQVVALVRFSPSRTLRDSWRGPARRLARRFAFVAPDPVVVWAKAAGVPIIADRRENVRATIDHIRSCSADIGCIATYPRKIPDALLQATGLGCLNMHPSLLPRHRGPNPLFWTYHSGDLEGGVTVHLATPRIDAGAILQQERFPIARGESVVDVHARAASRGGALLARAVTQVAKAEENRIDQDESHATPAASPQRGQRYADLSAWSCAQAWHFLAGLLARYRDPLLDTAGHPVKYNLVHGYEVRTPRFTPGSVVKTGAGWHAWTPDGVVELS